MEPLFHESTYILYYDKLIRSVGPVDYIVFMEPLYLMNSKIILTVAHLPVLWSDYWSPRAQQTILKTRHFRSRVGVSNVKMGVAKNFARTKRAFFILRTPLSKILNPPLLTPSQVEKNCYNYHTL